MLVDRFLFCCHEAITYLLMKTASMNQRHSINQGHMYDMDHEQIWNHPEHDDHLNFGDLDIFMHYYSLYFHCLKRLEVIK